MSFVDICNGLVRSRLKAIEDNPDAGWEGDIDGVHFVCRQIYADRKETRVDVIIDGWQFATEIERIPWNIRQPTSLSYWVWTDLPIDVVEMIIERAGLKDEKGVVPMEEFYPTENGPMRYNVHADTLEQVAALWKVWAPAYRWPSIDVLAYFLDQMDEKLIEATDEEGAHWPDVSGWAACCTTSARIIASRFGGKVMGFAGKDNPKAGILENCDGHDFAVLGHLLVDWWAHGYIGTHAYPRRIYNLDTDAELIEKIYGDRSKWEEVPID